MFRFYEFRQFNENNESMSRFTSQYSCSASQILIMRSFSNSSPSTLSKPIQKSSSFTFSRLVQATQNSLADFSRTIRKVPSILSDIFTSLRDVFHKVVVEKLQNCFAQSEIRFESSGDRYQLQRTDTPIVLRYKIPVEQKHSPRIGS